MLRLRMERERRGWSQAELARRVGIHQATMNRLENGKIYPYPGWKRRLAEVLELPGADLFEEVQPVCEGSEGA